MPWTHTHTHTYTHTHTPEGHSNSLAKCSTKNVHFWLFGGGGGGDTIIGEDLFGEL